MVNVNESSQNADQVDGAAVEVWSDDGTIDDGKPFVQRAEFAPLSDGATSGKEVSLELLMDVALHVSVELGRASMPIKEVLSLGPGSVIELDKLAGEPVSVLINGTPIATGEVVVVDEKFGVRVTSIVSPAARIGSLV